MAVQALCVWAASTTAVGAGTLLSNWTLVAKTTKASAGRGVLLWCCTSITSFLINSFSHHMPQKDMQDYTDTGYIKHINRYDSAVNSVHS